MDSASMKMDKKVSLIGNVGHFKFYNKNILYIKLLKYQAL